MIAAAAGICRAIGERVRHRGDPRAGRAVVSTAAKAWAALCAVLTVPRRPDAAATALMQIRDARP